MGGRELVRKAAVVVVIAQQGRQATPPVARHLTQTELLNELEPVAAKEVDRHLSMAADWQPHDSIPWDQERNYAMVGGTDWSQPNPPCHRSPGPR